LLHIINLVVYLYRTLKLIDMKKHNERNAGRKPKYNVPAKNIQVPLPIIEQVEELSKPYLNIKIKVK